jgi:hypothetical protein
MTEEMRQLIYCMHFKGQSSPATDEPRRIRVTRSATSCTVRTTVGPEGVAGSLEAAEGDLAFFEAEMHLTGAHTFSQEGTITFGENHLLRFTSAYEGHLGPSAGAGDCRRNGHLERGGRGRAVCQRPGPHYFQFHPQRVRRGQRLSLRGDLSSVEDPCLQNRLIALKSQRLIPFDRHLGSVQPGLLTVLAAVSSFCKTSAPLRLENLCP